MPQVGSLPATPASSMSTSFGATAEVRAGSCWLPSALVLLISALAFLLASFPARNGDLWTHLAAGKRIAEGHLALGTAADHNWLYDFIFFESYAELGGNGVVFLKALLVVGMALGLLRLSRSGAGWSIPAICATLAILTMGTRLLLQPATVSYAMFVGCLLLENRNERRGAWRGEAPVAILFMFWANMDSWFVLGLAVIALVRIGRILDRAVAASRSAQSPSIGLIAGELPRLVGSLSLVTAACLLNPAHLHAFVLPPEIDQSSRQVTAVFQKSYFADDTGLNPAGLAYFVLLGLGLLSFAMNVSRWHWRWFLPWAGLAVSSVFEVRAIPFFAVLAGPTTAWNLQARAVRANGKHLGRMTTALLTGLRLAPVAVLLALAASAWPGWLQAGPFEPRRWAIETAPSLERGAQTTSRWHRERKFATGARGLHLSPDSASAFAWFCPEENGVFDAGLTSIVLSASDGWEDRMRAEAIDHVIVYDADRGRFFRALDRFLNAPELWPLLYFEGDLAVFGWRDPFSADRFRGRELDLNHLAIRPESSKTAPRSRPDREPDVRHWWHAFWKPLPRRSIEADEATLLYLCAEAMRHSAPLRHATAWEGGQYLGIVAAASGWTNPQAFLDGHVRFTLFQPQLPEPGSDPKALPILDRIVLATQQRFVQQRDDSPAALLYLSIRAARRAIAANPDDGRAYLILGESYLALIRDTRERAWARRMPQLAEIRRAQASAALNQAVILDPNLSQAHFHLVALYRELGCLDLALDHQRAYFNLVQDAGPRAGIRREEFDKEMAARERALKQQAEAVENRLQAFAAEASRLRVYDRAVFAKELGLGGKARDILLESDVAAFGYQGMSLELDLLLKTGRAKDVRDWTGPEQQDRLGVSYFWVKGQAFAASGDYALAREVFAQLAAGGEGLQPTNLENTMAGIVGEAVLDLQAGWPSIPNVLWRAYRQAESRGRFASVARDLQQQADATVLQGLMALERGDIPDAAKNFRAALATWKDETTAAAGGGLDFSGRVIAQGYLAWIE